jgi:hypothetical protein
MNRQLKADVVENLLLAFGKLEDQDVKLHIGGDR